MSNEDFVDIFESNEVGGYTQRLTVGLPEYSKY